jgi:hypothetical protein
VDIPTLPQLIELTEWALIPVGPGKSRALFVTTPARSEWVAKLQDWCGRQGRDVWKVARENGPVVLAHFPAPDPYRENAIRHRIDAFLGDMDLWFGMAKAELAPRIVERVQSLGRLRDSIARARESAPGQPSPDDSLPAGTSNETQSR